MPRPIDLDGLTPAQRERVEQALVAARTPEARADEERVRAHFADRPSWAELIRRGEIDPERVAPVAAHESLLAALRTLKAARRDAGITQEQLSARSGLSPAQISRLESGRNPNPTFETIASYAAAFGMTLVVALDPAPNTAAHRPASKPSRT